MSFYRVTIWNSTLHPAPYANCTGLSKGPGDESEDDEEEEDEEDEDEEEEEDGTT